MSSRKDYDWFLRRGIITDECIGYFLQTAAGYWPEREMVCFEDRRYSYRDVYRWSVAMALMLAENGVCPGDRRPVAAGQVGEIRIRCPLLMIGYTDAKHNEAQFDGEGWFYTSDLGRLDGDDWLVFEGRLKDIINRGGEKFSSQDIEAAIAACPGITDVAVVGAPHPRFGEVVAAFVRLNPGETWRGPESVLLHLDRAQLAKQKWPVLWHVLPEFPRTPSGKVQKQALRQMLRDG
jgi:acyl-CoA synthetase (AMP-forming)/AMP-acid ligase II